MALLGDWNSRRVALLSFTLYRQYINSEDNRRISRVSDRWYKTFDGAVEAGIKYKARGELDIEHLLQAVVLSGIYEAGTTLNMNFKTGGKWDAKVPIKALSGLGNRDYMYPAQSDGASIRSDVFGNVIFGAMTARYHLELDTAQLAGNMGTPEAGIGNDPVDDIAIAIAIAIGFELFEKYSTKFTFRQYYETILAHCYEIECK
ncbi:polymorphic toxin type 44 domain-containing protein [Microbacterium pseudoresistens]|uniref:polymorphic toxin type 44 domain-containing protein n=1 Tax=Microbacterium pseudoresistens TaxID=640634 RepID=UPI0015C6EE5B